VVLLPAVDLVNAAQHLDQSLLLRAAANQAAGVHGEVQQKPLTLMWTTSASLSGIQALMCTLQSAVILYPLCGPVVDGPCQHEVGCWTRHQQRRRMSLMAFIER
jgi:hypothetical protein